MSRTVHIVDDDLGFLKGIKRLLMAHGLDVRAFCSVEDFLERPDPDEAACLILDVHMGRLSGIELMSLLLRSGSKIPIILVTANDSDHIRQAASNAGCSAFLQKPIPAKLLMDTLDSITGGAFSGLDSKRI